MTFHEPEYLGLFKIISGGQCGSDQGGLAAATKLGVLTGGVAPKGYRTQRGAAPELAQFGLTEDTSPAYTRRTQLNVQAADGTLIIASNIGSPGSRQTLSHARTCRKPVKVVIVENDYQDAWMNVRARDLSDWVVQNHIYVLNVAGNQDWYESSFHHRAAEKLVTLMLMDLREKNLLTTGSV